jgi:7-carboxy-7-deazaguanine synthase
MGALPRERERERESVVSGDSSLADSGSAGWLGEVCKARGYRYAHRLHIELYGNKRGT